MLDIRVAEFVRRQHGDICSQCVRSIHQIYQSLRPCAGTLNGDVEAYLNAVTEYKPYEN